MTMNIFTIDEHKVCDSILGSILYFNLYVNVPRSALFCNSLCLCQNECGVHDKLHSNLILCIVLLLICTVLSLLQE